jgi:plasmid replication initiation protein
MPDDDDNHTKEWMQMALPFPPQIVKKSNALCRARWSPGSILEPRIIALVASKINPGDDDSLSYDIPVSELFGKNYAGKELNDLLAASEKLVGRTVKLEPPDGKKGWDIRPLLSGCSYREHTGIFTVSIHPDIRPHFLWFKENVLQYTQYNLLEFMMLPSVYSQRLFEILKSWRDKPGYVESVDRLHEMLCTPKTLRENFKDFRIRVLEKARKDIQKHTSLRYTWTPIKDGRRVGSIRFSFASRRFGEQEVENAKKEQGKATAKAKKRTAAWKEAINCVRDKKGVCTLRDRAKIVCSICDEADMIQEFSNKKTQTNQ